MRSSKPRVWVCDESLGDNVTALREREQVLINLAGARPCVKMRKPAGGRQLLELQFFLCLFFFLFFFFQFLEIPPE